MSLYSDMKGPGDDNERVWRALSDALRRELLDSLARGPKTTSELVEITLQLRPVAAGEERITSHGVRRAEARYWSLDHPSATVGKFKRASELAM